MSSRLNRHEVSEGLHARVQAFAERSLHSDVGAELEQQEFDALACEIATHQQGERVLSLADVVKRGVVSDSFRFGRVFSFEQTEAQLRFVTSGTTSANSGVHYMRNRTTYEQLSLAWGQHGLGFVAHEPAPIVVALAPWTGLATSSSLGYMMQRFMERFDGRGLTPRREVFDFALDAPARWLVSPSGIDVAGLRRVCRLANEVGCRVTLLATSFALVELLDAIGPETFPLPAGSVVMPTGGFKGRSRTIESAVMHAELWRVFGDVDIVGEYGMTELTSQLYEATRRSNAKQASRGVYVAPPWLRVVALEPTTLLPVSHGEVGLACFIDLGNVDSAVCLLTQDLVRVDGASALGGARVQLLGRQPKAPLRGCSLAVEALLRPDVAVKENTKAGPQQTKDTANGAPDPGSLHEGKVKAAVRRVTALVEAASALQGRIATEADEATLTSLSASTGLSKQGVRLALQLSLETDVEHRDVEALVRTAQRAYGTTERRVWVLLSANVFIAPLRAIALAAALSPHVLVRPSRREPRFTELLHAAAPSAFELVRELAPTPGDVVLAYGSDETLDTVRSSLPREVSFFGHGHGMGVAVVGPAVAADAASLALDVVLFDQQGCASPRLVLVDAERDLDEFTEQLAAELRAWEARVPIGTTDTTQRHEVAWSERLARNLGRVVEAGSRWLACYDEIWAHRHAVPIPPACRSLTLVRTRDVVADLTALGSLVTTVGVSGDEALRARVGQCLPGARVTDLGKMQRPPFDGPLDRRHLPR